MNVGPATDEYASDLLIQAYHGKLKKDYKLGGLQPIGDYHFQLILNPSDDTLENCEKRVERLYLIKEFIPFVKKMTAELGLPSHSSIYAKIPTIVLARYDKDDKDLHYPTYFRNKNSNIDLKTFHFHKGLGFLQKKDGVEAKGCVLYQYFDVHMEGVTTDYQFWIDVALAMPPGSSRSMERVVQSLLKAKNFLCPLLLEYWLKAPGRLANFDGLLKEGRKHLYQGVENLPPPSEASAATKILNDQLKVKDNQIGEFLKLQIQADANHKDNLNNILLHWKEDRESKDKQWNDILGLLKVGTSPSQAQAPPDDESPVVKPRARRSGRAKR